MSDTAIGSVASEEIQAGVERESRKAVIVGTIGNVMEWFDFSVYGYFAPFLGTLFFPSHDPMASMLAAFAALAVGALLRPLGAVVFGWIGDVAGRRTSLTITVLAMAGATFAIGILPTYAQVGVLAPVLLIVCRLLQGLSAGGEWAGSAAFTVEYAPENRRGFVGSFQQVSCGIGFLLGSVFGWVVTANMSTQSILEWGWRLPFLTGILLGVVGVYMRLKLRDTPKFRAIKDRGETSKSPLLESLRTQWRGILVILGFNAIQAVGYWTMLVFMPSFTSRVLKLPASEALGANSIGALAFVVSLPFMGALSDRIGRKPMLIAATVIFMVITYPIFNLIIGGGLTTLILCQIVLGIVLATYNGPAVAATIEIFPTRLRYTSVSIGFNLAVVIFGMSSPMISTFLIRTFNTSVAPGYVIIAAAAITFVTVVFGFRETAGKPLR